MATQRVSPSAAIHLQTRLQQELRHDHVKVHPYGGHLIIEMHVTDEVYKVARLTLLPGQEYGLSYRTPGEKWEPMPFSGPLDEMASAIAATLGPYLDPATYAVL